MAQTAIFIACSCTRMFDSNRDLFCRGSNLCTPVSTTHPTAWHLQQGERFPTHSPSTPSLVSSIRHSSSGLTADSPLLRSLLTGLPTYSHAYSPFSLPAMTGRWASWWAPSIALWHLAGARNADGMNEGAGGVPGGHLSPASTDERNDPLGQNIWRTYWSSNKLLKQTECCGLGQRVITTIHT